MEMPELPKKTLFYKLDPELYDKFIADIEAPVGDMEKTVKLFQRPSPFTRDTDCE